MINHRLPLLLTLGFCLAGSLDAQVPQLINYQGRVVVGGTNFNGAGQFKFALVQGAGPTQTGFAPIAGPEVGVLFTIADGLALVLAGRYQLAFADIAVNDDPALPVIHWPSWVAIQAGVAFY